MLFLSFILGLTIGITLTLLFSKRISDRIKMIIYKIKFNRVLKNHYYSQDNQPVKYPKVEDV